MAWLAGVQLNPVFLFPPSQAVSESTIFEWKYQLLRCMPTNLLKCSEWTRNTESHSHGQRLIFGCLPWLWWECGVECELETLEDLVLDVHGGRQLVVSGPLLGEGDSVVGALVLGLQASGNLAILSVGAAGRVELNTWVQNKYGVNYLRDLSFIFYPENSSPQFCWLW